MYEEKDFFIYILASKKNGVLYSGVTSDLIRRVWQHKNNINDGFASRYKVYKLVFMNSIIRLNLLYVERDA